ncbi:MAG TPA: rhodanese-like domain-containing protein [Terriglobales bacterium]|nr:rhodanese-like domain-containing protein [Terriglobales bacterium]
MADEIRITPDEVRRRMQSGEQFTFLDSRNPHAWAQSDVTLPGAIRVPADQVDKHLSEIPKNQPVVAYCT